MDLINHFVSYDKKRFLTIGQSVYPFQIIGSIHLQGAKNFNYMTKSFYFDSKLDCVYVWIISFIFCHVWRAYIKFTS